MGINITFILVLIILIAGVILGFRAGLTKSTTALIFFLASFIMFRIGIYIYYNYEMKNGLKVFLAILFLVIFGAAFGLIRVALKAMKAIANLPIIKLLDHVAGGLAGILISVLIIEVIIVLAVYGTLGDFSNTILQNISENDFLSPLFMHNIFI